MAGEALELTEQGKGIARNSSWRQTIVILFLFSLFDCWGAILNIRRPAGYGTGDRPRYGRRTKTIALPGGAELELLWCKPGSRFRDYRDNPEETNKGFWIGLREVTCAQWNSVMGLRALPATSDDSPVDQVSYDDCQNFCDKIGRGAHLPSETEWLCGFSFRGGGCDTAPMLHESGNEWEWCLGGICHRGRHDRMVYDYDFRNKGLGFRVCYPVETLPCPDDPEDLKPIILFFVGAVLFIIMIFILIFLLDKAGKKVNE